MNFDQVPAELRALRQWTVWRPVLRRQADGQTKVTKPPYRPDDPSIPADPHDPYTWGSFEEAVATYERHRSVLGGIGFMLTQADPYVVVDVDNKEKVPQGMEGYRQEFEKQLWSLGTYTEHSPSDTGWHVWMRATMAVAGRHLQGVGSEVYAWQRFITVTGRPVSAGHAGVVLDCQDFVAMVGLGEAAPEMAVEDDAAKPCDLTDQEVLARAHAYVSHFAERWAGHAGCGPGEWSHTFVNVVGVLDRITGSVAQLQRLIFNAPMVVGQHVQPAGSGESRPAKARRTLTNVLSRVRHSNRGGSYFVSHGREVWQAIEAERDRYARERAAAHEARMEEARIAEEEARRAGTVDLKGSANAPAVVARFKNLGGDATALRVPPGVAGEMVLASMRASPVPYLKYALPAALSTLSGILARAYAPDKGGPMNMNYILVAPSSTGKTVSMDVWDDFLNEASLRLPITVKPTNRLIKNATSSVQGIWPVFEAAPCSVWFIEEASAQFNAMSNAKTATDEHLRNLYNELYDSGKHGKMTAPPRSVANRNAGIGPINKLCVSTYWTTTPEKFTLSDSDIRDGFASRVVFIHHDTSGGLRVRDFDRRMPVDLLDRLVQLLTQANHVDRAYETAADTADQFVIRVDTTAVDEMWWELDMICDRVNRDAIEGRLPKVYQMLSRLPMNTRRLCCLLAVVENPWAPRVTPEQFTWAHNYLMHNAIGILAAMDAGEVGDNQTDEVLAAKRLWKELAKKGVMKGLPGIPQSKLLTYMAGHTPFRKHRDGRTKAAANTIKLMVEQGLFEETQLSAPGRGKPTRYLMLNEELLAG